MTENNKDTKLPTESQNMSESNKPWYKKKNTIIASSSILGAGVLATVIAVPIALTSNNTTTTTNQIVTDTINLLNKEGNKSSRLSVWNAYAQFLNTPINDTGLETPYTAIVKNDTFIDEFINLLTHNLYITANASEVGSITNANARNINTALTNSTNKPLFKDVTNAIYTNLFNFASNTVMFQFMDSTLEATSTIAFELFMPSSGLDLTFNSDSSISLKIATHSTTATDNVRLSISKFVNPAIATATNYYFKAGSIINLPSAVMPQFPNFFNAFIKQEEFARTELEKNYKNLKTSVDKSDTSGLSYWNSFALNYAASNTAFLKADFAKEPAQGGLYQFLVTNAPTISSADLIALSKELQTDATNGLNKTPFVDSPTYSNLLFNTTNTNENKYSLELDITKFSYEYKIDNLFSSPSPITITPKLDLTGSFNVIPQGQSPTITSYPITVSNYDFSKLINMANVPFQGIGGLPGFLQTLVNVPTSALTKLTNGLVAFNNKTDAEKITIWNGFTSTEITKLLILAELQKVDVLYNFVRNNVDLTNTFGKGTFPIIDDAIFKTSFNTAANALITADLSFVTPGVAAITLPNVVWGADANTNKFTNITIYFGYEVNSLSNINLTSTYTGSTNTGSISNMSLSQTAGESTASNLDTLDKLKAAAAKRFSVIFQSSTDDSVNHIAYFGQKKVNAEQVLNPIIIPQTILTHASTFIEVIQKLK